MGCANVLVYLCGWHCVCVFVGGVVNKRVCVCVCVCVCVRAHIYEG